MDERFMATKICNKLISEQIISEKDFEVYVYAYEITFIMNTASAAMPRII